MSAAEHNRRVFISYRREDSSGYAGRIRDELQRRVTAKGVHFDLDTTPGERFPDVIREGVENAAVVVAVIGPQWMATLNERAARPDETDWLRAELENALEARIPVVPVLVRGAELPARNVLPE